MELTEKYKEQQVIEIYGDKIRIIGLSRTGIWLSLFEFHITPEIEKVFRVPLLFKIEGYDG